MVQPSSNSNFFVVFLSQFFVQFFIHLILMFSFFDFGLDCVAMPDTMARQVAMALKCLLLIYYKNGRGHNFRRQVL